MNNYIISMLVVLITFAFNSCDINSGDDVACDGFAFYSCSVENTLGYEIKVIISARYKEFDEFEIIETEVASGETAGVFEHLQGYDCNTSAPEMPPSGFIELIEIYNGSTLIYSQDPVEDEEWGSEHDVTSFIYTLTISEEDII